MGNFSCPKISVYSIYQTYTLQGGGGGEKCSRQKLICDCDTSTLRVSDSDKHVQMDHWQGGYEIFSVSLLIGLCTIYICTL